MLVCALYPKVGIAMSRSARRSGSGRALPVWMVQRASMSFWRAFAG